MFKLLMNIGITIVALLGVVLVVMTCIGIPGCIVDDTSSDTDVDADSDSDSDADSDSDSDSVFYDEITVCSVGIRFAYHDDNIVYQVTLTNYNSVTAMVVMNDITNAGTPAHNCLWPADYVGTGEGGDEDVNSTSFSRDDELAIDVRTLADLDLGLTCDLSFTYYWDSYAEECESVMY